MFNLFKKKDKEKTCNEEVGILDIRNNYIYTRDGNVISGIKIYSINTQLLTDREKENLINDLSAELSSEQEDIKYFNIARAVDISPLQEYLSEIIGTTDNAIQKRFLDFGLTIIIQIIIIWIKHKRLLWRSKQVYFT